VKWSSSRGSVKAFLPLLARNTSSEERSIGDIINVKSYTTFLVPG